MKIKTQNLTGKALDWTVAKASQPVYSDTALVAAVRGGYDGIGHFHEPFNPSTDWAQGGPLKEREGIVSGPSVKGDFFAFKPVKDADSAKAFGPIELVAAMRCLVAVKLGDEVDIPDELAP